MVTVVAPTVGPDLGLRAVTAGMPGTKVKRSALPGVLVPPGAVTTMCTAAVLVVTGLVAVMMVAAPLVATALTLWAAGVPKVTVVAAVRKLVPVMTTTVPPATGPELRLRALMVGGARV